MLRYVFCEARRRSSTKCDQHRVARFPTRHGFTGDHVLRTEEQFSVFIRTVGKEPRDAAVDRNVGMALAETKIMNADVARTVAMNRGGYSVPLAEVRNNQRGKR